MRRTELALLIATSLSWISASDQKGTATAGGRAAIPRLTEEEKEIIRNRELLENLDLLEDFDSIHWLRLLTQDSTGRTKSPTALQKGAGQNAKKKKNP